MKKKTLATIAASVALVGVFICRDNENGSSRDDVPDSERVSSKICKHKHSRF
ncbi:hypothetical protein LR69_00782 [Geobacillus sp. BCO2]|nr:hypothetical protein LR69_00782 [Geobacillus sp. BCO2]